MLKGHISFQSARFDAYFSNWFSGLNFEAFAALILSSGDEFLNFCPGKRLFAGRDAGGFSLEISQAAKGASQSRPAGKKLPGQALRLLKLKAERKQNNIIFRKRDRMEFVRYRR